MLIYLNTQITKYLNCVSFERFTNTYVDGLFEDISDSDVFIVVLMIQLLYLNFIFISYTRFLDERLNPNLLLYYCLQAILVWMCALVVGTVFIF